MTHLHVIQPTPATRAGCADLPRPCPALGCRYHTGGPRSCVLDIAEDGGWTQAEVAEELGVGQNRVQQLEEVALRKLKRRIAFLNGDITIRHHEPVDEKAREKKRAYWREYKARRMASDPEYAERTRTANVRYLARRRAEALP